MSLIAHSTIRKEVIVAIAITTVISMATLHLSVLGPFLGLFVPLPILFYRSKLGRSAGLLILMAVGLIMISLAGWKSVGTAVFFFELGLVGLILPEMFQMKLSVERTIGITVIGVLAAGALMLALYTLLSTTSPLALVSDYVEQSVRLALAMYTEMNTSEETVQIIVRSLDDILYVIVRIIPAVLVATTLFVVWSNLLLARYVLTSKQLFCPDFGRLNRWRAPEMLVWFAIGSGIMVLVGHPGLKMLGINGLIVLMMVYFFQGIAIVSFYFEKKQLRRIWRIILYGLIAMQHLLLLVVIAVGFFDMWIDFRRIRKAES